jgi:hypothetical protein
MSLPSLSEVTAVYSQPMGSDIGRLEHALFQRYGLEDLIPLLVEAFPKLSRGQGRASILFWLPRFARTHEEVVTLAISALADRSYLVREYACSILAYSLRPDVLPHLARLQTHRDAKTRLSAAAAQDAIEHKNHHYYIDRRHTGNTFWAVNPGEASGL